MKAASLGLFFGVAIVLLSDHSDKSYMERSALRTVRLLQLRNNRMCVLVEKSLDSATHFCTDERNDQYTVWSSWGWERVPTRVEVRSDSQPQ